MTKKHAKTPRITDQYAVGKRQAQRILENVSSEAESVGTSSMDRAANRVIEQTSGAENDVNDPVEILGKRIARVLSAIAFIALAIYLAFTYILK